MKLWKVLARTSHVYSNSYNKNKTNLFEMKSRSPTFSEDSGKHSGDSLLNQGTFLATVHLRKRPGESLGIILGHSGNSELEPCPSILSLRAGSIALNCDQLAPGDRIHSINGINTTKMRPDEVTTLLENVDGNALMEIEYCLPNYESQNSLCVTSKITEVLVERVDASLGITLRGGAVLDHPHLSRPLIITQVRPNGPAYRTGLIRVGDRLLKVDNQHLTNKTLLEAQKILKDSSLQTMSSLTIEYDVSIMESVKYATGPLLVEIDRNINEDLGIILSNCCDYAPPDEITPAGVFIENIIPASTADRCGALNIGDQLLGIDDISLEDWNGGTVDAEILLKTAGKIQILPLHALHRASSRNYGPYGNSPTMSGFSTINSKRSRNIRNRNNRHSSVSKSIEDTSNYGYINNLGVCHSDNLNVILVAERGKGYGIRVGIGEQNDNRPSDIIINRISTDSPAYRCGCLQNGDRIVSVNHQQNLTLQEINSILEMGTEASNTGKIVLQIEFDVADTIVPSSGIFTVKLAKRGSGLGITITASKAHPDDPFIISEIRRGSIADRTGTLHAGDRLLAIDNRPLDHLSMESAFDILQTSTNDIVTLKIEKTETEQANLLMDNVVYTVELVRYGGPLGITIAGSEDCVEPIVLSRLTEGGLAEKTGALHVGDRILAINSENLENRPLSEAIRLLQNSGDRVQLRISRTIKTEATTQQEENRCNYSSPGLTSIDSAIHSWDSNPDQQQVKDFESVLSEPLSYQDQEIQKPDNLQFYSDVDDTFCPSPLPLPNYNFTNTLNKYEANNYFQSRANNLERLPDTFSNDSLLDNEIYHVTLYKDSVYDDYGFSVSDGLYERGVFINRIRNGGPADIVGLLKPYDRIIQVNDTKTQDFDCCLTVPLIASAGDRIELIIARNPYGNYALEKDRINDVISRKSFTTSQNTITKTL